MKKKTMSVILFFFFSCSLVSENLYATIEFSNQTIFQGEIKPPMFLRIHGKKQLQTIESKLVQEIRFSIEKKEMLQSFWFPEPGKPDKEKSGEPYPVIYLQSSVFLYSGEKKEGHLYTTVFYLTKEDKTEKLVLFYKMRGKEKGNYEEIVYPKSIVFHKTKPGVSSKISITIAKSLLASKICLLTRENLMRVVPEMDVHNKGQGSLQKGAFWISQENQKEGYFIAFYKHNQIFVEWPFPEDKKNMVLVQTSLADVQDFFDRKKLLAVWQKNEETIYSLMLLERKGHTTYKKEKKYPWRLEIWRWKYDAEENRLMLSAREYFFRGIISEKEAPPDILIQENFKEES